MKKTPEPPPSRRDGRRAWLADCTAPDFEGHTRFAELTAEQRLDWLAAAAALVRDLKAGTRAP